MPTIAFSDAFMSGSASTYMGRLMAYNSINNNGLLSPGSDGWSGYRPAGYLMLMKGTVPTDFTGLTAYSSRSSDRLCSWVIANGDTNNFSPSASSVNSNPNTIETGFVAAEFSGTATWFWFFTRGWAPYVYPTYPSGYSDTIYSQIVGTVTATGGGGDLEIASTTITANQLLRVMNFRIELPSTYTY